AGKVYYDLLAKKQEDQRDDVAILRLEQYYPFPDTQLLKAIEAYSSQTPIVYVQEEPENMGAWRFVEHHVLARRFGHHDWEAVTRPESASPATGSKQAHEWEQRTLLAEAFGEK